MIDLASITAELAAREGDYRLIIERLRDTKRPLEEGERLFLADLLEGRHRRKRGRPQAPNHRRELQKTLVAQFVFDLLSRNVPHHEAIATAAKTFDRGKDWVRKIISEARSDANLFRRATVHLRQIHDAIAEAASWDPNAKVYAESIRQVLDGNF